MNYDTALTILEIDKNTQNITFTFIKKKYHKIALLNHPDKNGNSEESNEKFKKINDAYEYLKNSHESKDDQNSNESMDYLFILKMFTNSFFNVNSDNNNSESRENTINTILNIILQYKNISFSLFDKLDKQTSFEIYNFILKNKDILHINEETIDCLKKIIQEKCSYDEIYILNPTLDDLLEHKIYKLVIDNKIYFIPLWHNELIIDDEKDKANIIVKCIPELPDHIQIDKNNNILIDLEYPFTQNLLREKFITTSLYEKNFSIPLEKLYIKEKQSYIFRNCGISREKNIYENGQLSNIIFNVIFTAPGNP
jgi:hypothetical protein